MTIPDSLSDIAREGRLVELIYDTILSIRICGTNCGGKGVVLRPLEMSSRLYCDWSVEDRPRNGFL